MVSFFKEKSPTAVFGLVIVSAVTRLFFFQQAPQIITSPGDGLMYLLLSKLSFIPAPGIGFLYHAIIILQALRLNYALNDVRMFTKTGYTTALAYILLTALVPAWNNISAALIVNSMLIWIVFRLFQLYNSPNPKTLIFNIGIIVSCTVLLYFPALPLVLLAFIAVASFRSFHLNEWMTLLLGLVTPLYFLACGLFLNDKLIPVIQQLNIFDLQVIRPGNLAATIITFTVAVLTIVAGVYTWQSNSGRMVIQVRKNWSIIFFMLLLFIPVVFVIKDAWPFALLLITVPAAGFVGNTFQQSKRNIFSALLFWLFIALIVYNNWIVTKF